MYSVRIVFEVQQEKMETVVKTVWCRGFQGRGKIIWHGRAELLGIVIRLFGVSYVVIANPELMKKEKIRANQEPQVTAQGLNPARKNGLQG